MRARGYTKAWTAWLALSVLGFTLIEGKALREPGATLTAHIYHLAGFGTPGHRARIRRALFYAAWGWLPLHVAQHAARCVSCISPPMPPP